MNAHVIFFTKGNGCQIFFVKPLCVRFHLSPLFSLMANFTIYAPKGLELQAWK